MPDQKSGNDLHAPVPRFCLALEEHRRTPEGRIRAAQEFVQHFFPQSNGSYVDRIFRYLPNEVRGPTLAAWGIRGLKTALRDSAEKVQSVVADGLDSGDLDAAAFEEGLAADTVVRWLPLEDWWSFWRAGKQTRPTLRRALEAGHELGLFDARWFLDTITDGEHRGTDMLARGLTKEDLTEWMRRVHERGDGSPEGIVSALGWEKIAAKTTLDVLGDVIDALALKIGLVRDALEPELADRAAAPGLAKSTPPVAVDEDEADLPDELLSRVEHEIRIDEEEETDLPAASKAVMELRKPARSRG